MFPIEARKSALISLGSFLGQFGPGASRSEHALNDNYFDAFTTLIDNQFEKNAWFTPDNVRFAIGAWAHALRPDGVNKWFDLENMPEELSDRKVGVIMAGNIPLVGFHDMLSVLAAGYILRAKLSSDDNHLLPVLGRLLEEIEPKFSGRFSFTEERLGEVDAVIATGSGNTARYFEYYFRDKPSLIRKNRSSVAIIDGDETEEELALIGQDMLRYFGMGCRNVSKIFLPEGFNLDRFFGAVYPFKEIIEHHKYANNYDYHRAIFVMNRDEVLENGFMLLKKDEKLKAPVSTVFYEEYSDNQKLKDRLLADKDELQCIVSKNNAWPMRVAPGDSQRPELWEYADGVNTIKFLKVV
jgi:hypothetical protein